VEIVLVVVGDNVVFNNVVKEDEMIIYRMVIIPTGVQVNDTIRDI
jgi:hypothetical protein